MAQMYPAQVEWKPGYGAEWRLYEAFRDQLDDGYHVFYSVAWQSLDSAGRPRDGEADFIIAHPDRGILVLEAKGGQIDYDPRAGRWTSTDAAGRAHDIKDPFEQGRNSYHILLDLIKSSLKRSERVNIGNAVAFPDVAVGTRRIGLDKPREVILDMTDLPSASSWVGRVLAYWRGKDTQRDTAPGKEGVQFLIDLLARKLELRPALWGEFAQEKQELIRLTEQQFMLLDMLNRQRRALISGCAGSGKTMVAAEKAVRLARQGFRVLLTCFNKPLAADLIRRLRPPPNLHIQHFHSLCSEMATQADIRLDHAAKDYFQRLLPEALMDAADRLRVRYDAVVVDEGQDFRSEWWIALQSLLNDPEGGIFYIFYDDNQRIYGKGGEFPIQQPPYPLTVNCRNTQAIHRQVLRFYEGESLPTVLGPSGRPVEIIEFENDRFTRTLQDTLHRLTYNDHIPTDEIVLLTPLSLPKSQLVDTVIKGTRLAFTWPPEPNQFYFATIHAFKGLESAVVVLIEADRWRAEEIDLESILYVACSRARHHLIVLLPKNAPVEVRNHFSPISDL